VNAIGGRVASVPIGLAVAILLITVAIVPFLTPGWVAFEQGRAQAAAWTGYSTSELNAATDAILSDLMFGGDFAVAAGEHVEGGAEPQLGRVHLGRALRVALAAVRDEEVDALRDAVLVAEDPGVQRRHVRAGDLVAPPP